MSFVLSKRSLRRVKGVDLRLIDLIQLAITRTPIDFGVAWMGGVRTAEEQNQLFKDGFSQRDGYLKISEHQLARALDLNIFVGSKVVMNKEMSCVVAGVMFSCADELGIKIRWGGDWDGDGNLLDNIFNDLFHYELL